MSKNIVSSSQENLEYNVNTSTVSGNLNIINKNDNVNRIKLSIDKMVNNYLMANSLYGLNK